MLRALDAHPSDVLVRMSSLEPMDCTAGVVELVTGSTRFAPHFHLPLQHASDAVLRRMRRPYTATGYRRVVTAIRDRLPHAALGTDLVVGFPGETDADAAATLGFLDDSPLTYLHVFPYSYGAPGFLGHGLRENPMSKEVGGMVGSRRVKGAGSALTEGAWKATGVSADGAAVGSRALAPGQRWSASRKRDVVLRLLARRVA